MILRCFVGVLQNDLQNDWAVAMPSNREFRLQCRSATPFLATGTQVFSALIFAMGFAARGSARWPSTKGVRGLHELGYELLCTTGQPYEIVVKVRHYHVPIGTAIVYRIPAVRSS